MASYRTLLLSLTGLMAVFMGLVWKVKEGGEGVDCETGQFRLRGMEQCVDVLGCEDIAQQVIVSDEVIGLGAVKLVRRGKWWHHDVAVNTLNDPQYRQDFLHGLHMLQQLRSSVRVTQLVGACDHRDIFVTEFHPLGSVDRLEEHLLEDEFRKFNTLSVRFVLCEDYVSILHSLHSGVDGARVMCDSNELNKTLSQFLLHRDFSLILNDVDALPLANKGEGQLVKCGHRELFGTFVAPEQLWPYEDRDFNDSSMPGYDEKVDIWKVPDVCEAFVGDADGNARLRLHLLPVHLKCKSVDPSERPPASELMQAYKNVRKKLQL